MDSILNAFLEKVKSEPQIGATHISLFSAILSLKKAGSETCIVCRRVLMSLSKIKSFSTYHKCIHDLVKMESIVYIPSFEPSGKTRVRICE